VGSNEWTSLPTQVQGDDLVASIDDEVLPRGHFELRAIARDQAGLTAIADKRRDGSAAAFDVPLRVPMLLQAGFSRVKHIRRHGRVFRRRVLVPSRKARFGHKAIVTNQPENGGYIALGDAGDRLAYYTYDRSGNSAPRKIFVAVYCR
jgi:hypothetical protein